MFAFDPGYRHESGAGWAYLENGMVVDAGIASAGRSGHRHGELLGGLDKIFNVLHQLEPVFERYSQVEILAAEIMRWYPNKRDSRPNTLIPLSVLSGFVLGRIDAQEYVYPTPQEWKGTVSKDVHNKRTERALTNDEMKIVTESCSYAKRHNVVDAVALAKWASGRWKSVTLH